MEINEKGLNITPEEYEKLIYNPCNEACKATAIFLMKDKEGFDVPQGSGVFLSVDKDYFLLTAAHVIEDYQDKIYVPFNEEKNEAIKLGGYLVKNSLQNGQNREYDKIDIAILKLDSETVEKVKKQYTFISNSDIQVNHELKNIHSYWAIGYPDSLVKLNKYKRKLDCSHPFVYTTKPSSKEEYKKLKYESYLNVIVDYDKNIYSFEQNRRIKAIELFGISGGGLWYFSPKITDNKIEIKKNLIGILTTWPEKNKKCMVATRIDYFTEVLRKEFKVNIEKTLFFLLE